MSFRQFTEKVGVNCTQISEFKVGDRVLFYDEYTGESGEGVIEAFAESAYKPVVWYRDNCHVLKMTFLGWCKKV